MNNAAILRIDAGKICSATAYPPQEINPFSPIFSGMNENGNRYALAALRLQRAELAERLTEPAFAKTKASIANKLARATLTAYFFLAGLAAIGK